MKRTMMAAALAAMLATGAAAQTAPAKLTLTRLDCGSSRGAMDIAAFSDTHAYEGKTKQLTVSCYLIRHGDDVMIWDTGNPVAVRDDPKAPMTMTVTIVDQLKTLKIDPAKVKYVGVSHYHGDHTGQARDFPGAILLIGANDWAAITSTPPAPYVDPKPFASWIAGGKVDPVWRDKDVFGDGRVVMLDTPGHTPGHHALLVRLKQGNILLTGDLTHFAENYATDGIPTFNTNRADTLASLDRFKKIAANLKATVIIQHEPADVAKLPAFPAAAE